MNNPFLRFEVKLYIGDTILPSPGSNEKQCILSHVMNSKSTIGSVPNLMPITNKSQPPLNQLCGLISTISSNTNLSIPIQGKQML